MALNKNFPNFSDRPQFGHSSGGGPPQSISGQLGSVNTGRLDSTCSQGLLPRVPDRTTFTATPPFHPSNEQRGKGSSGQQSPEPVSQKSHKTGDCSDLRLLQQPICSSKEGWRMETSDRL